MNLCKLFIYIVTLLAFTFTIVNAEENDGNQDDQTKEEQVTETANKEKSVKQNANKRSQVKTLEKFIPSEEVSADKPVAFPADI